MEHAEMVVMTAGMDEEAQAREMQGGGSPSVARTGGRSPAFLGRTWGSWGAEEVRKCLPAIGSVFRPSADRHIEGRTGGGKAVPTTVDVRPPEETGMRIIGVGEGRSYEQAKGLVDEARRCGCIVEVIAGGWIVHEVVLPGPKAMRPEDFGPKDIPGWGRGC